MIQAVIFDIGNVLIGWQPEQFFDREIGSDRRTRLFAEVDLHEMNNRVDMGHPFSETVLGMIDTYPDWEVEIRLWHDRWVDLTGPVIERSVRMMRALRGKGVPVHALTNFGVESYALACEQPEYDFLNEFDVPFVSGRMKMVKPDPRSSLRLSRSWACQPKACSSPMTAPTILPPPMRGDGRRISFWGAEGLANALVANGLLTEAEAA